MRRLGAVLVGVVLVAVLVPVLPAGAAPGGTSFSLAVRCNPATGQFESQVTVQAGAAAITTITSALQTAPSPVVDFTSAFSPNPLSSGQTSTGTVTSPGTTTSLSFEIKVTADLNPPVTATFTPGSLSPCAQTATMQVEPVVVAPGGSATVSGTGCTRATPVSLAATGAGTVSGTVAFTPPLGFGPITANADGTWSTPIVVPAGTPAGTYPVNATCTLPATTAAGNAGALTSVSGGDVTLQAVTNSGFDYVPQNLTVVVPIEVTPDFAG